MGDNLMAPFQFAMNDVYLRDTSRKVTTLDMKRKKGKVRRVPAAWLLQGRTHY